MLDKNGMEIKTGDVVRISGAYFKNDNAIFFVTHSPGDITWSGKYHSLTKISKAGKISKAKYNLSSWPLSIYTNSWEKREEGNAWNKEHAEIEILDTVPMAEIKAYFEEKAKEEEAAENSFSYRFGEASEITQQAKNAKEHYKKMAARISAKGRPGEDGNLPADDSNLETKGGRTMKKFEPGKSYYDRSACDHNCIFAYTIKKRTAKTAVIVDRNGKEYRKRIYIYGDEENISLGSYSMAPVLSAGHELPGEGTLIERIDEMHRADAERDHRAFLRNVMYQNFKRFSEEYEGGLENAKL